MTHFDKIQKHLLQNQYRWLITGVAGFIGSNLLEKLLNLNQIVMGIDNFSTGSQKNIDNALEGMQQDKRDNFTFYEADICALENCYSVVKNIDFVLHQAALGSVPRSIASPEKTNENNVNGFLNILLASKAVNVKRFIYASSSSVYGDSSQLPKVESHIGNPLSPYAVSKYANELYAKAFANCYDVTTIGLRYFNIFGPRQNPQGPYAAVIPLWIGSILNQQDVYINGDGKTSRDFCYIDNAIQANLLATFAENEAVNRVYNVTVGKQTTLNELYTMIALRLGCKNKSPIYRAFREGDIQHSLADINLAKNLLHYSPTHNIENGLTKTVEWFCGQHNQK